MSLKLLRLLRLCLLISCVFLLAACARHTVLPSTTMGFNVPPSALLSDCTLAVPPSEEDLMEPLLIFPQADSVEEARVLVVTEYAMEQTKMAGECRRQLNAIRLWAEQYHEWEVTP